MTFTRKEFHEHSAQLDADQAQKEEEPTRNNKFITVFGIVKSSYYPPEDRSERYGNYPSSSNYNPTLLWKTTSPLDYVWILDIGKSKVTYSIQLTYDIIQRANGSKETDNTRGGAKGNSQSGSGLHKWRH